MFILLLEISFVVLVKGRIRGTFHTPSITEVVTLVQKDVVVRGSESESKKEGRRKIPGDELREQ